MGWGCSTTENLTSPRRESLAGNPAGGESNEESRVSEILPVHAKQRARASWGARTYHHGPRRAPRSLTIPGPRPSRTWPDNRGEPRHGSAAGLCHGSAEKPRQRPAWHARRTWPRLRPAPRPAGPRSRWVGPIRTVGAGPTRPEEVLAALRSRHNAGKRGTGARRAEAWGPGPAKTGVLHPLKRRPRSHGAPANGHRPVATQGTVGGAKTRAVVRTGGPTERVPMMLQMDDFRLRMYALRTAQM